MNNIYVCLLMPVFVLIGYSGRYIDQQPNQYPPESMRNPVDRAIRAMTLSAGIVGLIVLIVFQLL